tara:strand:- start:25294 stop:26286 length:993 start_codon:yes stop_codon:yes gene_type:complete
MEKVINVGITGFGRVGKCVFLQLLEMEGVSIKVVNTSLSLDSIERYINRDSVHGKKTHVCTILDDNNIIIDHHMIRIVSSRVPGEINWRELGVDYLFETTGVFLTKDELRKHPVDHVLLSSPPKDDIKMFCYGVNHEEFRGEKIISTASCTTNCIVPILNFADKMLGGIEEGSFITVHSATASQSVVDMARDKKRTNRSIFNNIIPHTTGASKCIDKILPKLKGKIAGTSVRVPVSNVSMIDLNLRFSPYVSKEMFFSILEEVSNDDVVIVNRESCVSSDFIGCYSPCIVDYNSTTQISRRSLKIQLWYDNEWSYAAQMIRMCDYMSSVR